MYNEVIMLEPFPHTASFSGGGYACNAKYRFNKRIYNLPGFFGMDEFTDYRSRGIRCF
jgi:hypothetical protein